MSRRQRINEWALKVAQGRTLKPRELDSSDVESFLLASYTGPPRRTRIALAGMLRARNPHRFARLQGDLKWAEHELEKVGMNPRDARFLI